MTYNDCVSAIAAAVPERYAANATAMATGLLNKAVLKVGRTPGANWNSEGVTFTLTSGTSNYKIGDTILGQYADPVSLQNLWRTDTRDDEIDIVSLGDFNACARGSTTTGPPEIATLHSSDETLEFYPIPDSGYTIWGLIQKEITKFEDIPDRYHDVLVDEAIASLDPRYAAMRAKEGLQEIADASLTRWDGDHIPITRHLGDVGGSVGSDSSNLRGD